MIFFYCPDADAECIHQHGSTYCILKKCPYLGKSYLEV